MVTEDGVEDFGLDADRVGEVVELGEEAVEDVRRERNRVVGVVVAVDDVADVVQLRRESDDDRLVGLVEPCSAAPLNSQPPALSRSYSRSARLRTISMCFGPWSL